MFDQNNELVKAWLEDLNQKNAKWIRLNAIQKLSGVRGSSNEIVRALVNARDHDPDEEIRTAALLLLEQPTHVEMLSKVREKSSKSNISEETSRDFTEANNEIQKVLKLIYKQQIEV